MACWSHERIEWAIGIRHEFLWLAVRGLAIRGSTVVCWWKSFHSKCLSPGWYHWVWHLVVVYTVGPILKEPQCGNIDKQIEATLNCESPLVWPQTAKHTAAVFNFPDYSHCLLVLLPNPFLLDSRRTLSFTDYWGLNRYHIISYDIVSCRMIWYDTIACPIILYCVVSYIALYYIIAYPIILYRIIPCHIIRTSGNAFFI